MAKDKCNTAKRGRKEPSKKVRAQNNFIILPKNRALVPGYSSSEYPGNEVGPGLKGSSSWHFEIGTCVFQSALTSKGFIQFY